jgi:hypothetical protein
MLVVSATDALGGTWRAAGHQGRGGTGISLGRPLGYAWAETRRRLHLQPMLILFSGEHE